MKEKEDNQLFWSQFIKLGDMMGDGLHYEEGGGWIKRDYARLAKILIPEIKDQYKKERQDKNKRIDEAIARFLPNKTCECGAQLKQKRSGSMELLCTACPLTYTTKYAKRK